MAISTTGPGALVAIHGHSRNLLTAPLAIGGQFDHSRSFIESACSRMAALCPMHILLTLVPVVLGICSHMSLRMWAFCLPFCARRSGHSSAFVCVCPMSVGCKSAPRPAAKVSGGRLLLRRSLAAVCPPPPPSEARCHTSARAPGRRCTPPHTHTPTHTHTPVSVLFVCVPVSACAFVFLRFLDTRTLTPYLCVHTSACWLRDTLQRLPLSQERPAHRHHYPTRAAPFVT